MSPNWSGRAARTMSECRFTDDADPFERSSRAKTSNAEIFAYIVGLVLVLAVVHFVAR